MTLTTTGPRSMRLANAMLERSAVVLLKGFAVNQMKVASENSVDVTSDNMSVRFCAFLWLLSFTQVKESDWPSGQKHPSNSPIHEKIAPIIKKTTAPPPATQKSTPSPYKTPEQKYSSH